MRHFAAYLAKARRGQGGPEYAIVAISSNFDESGPPNIVPNMIGLGTTRAAAVEDLRDRLAEPLGHAAAIARDLDARDARQEAGGMAPLFEEAPK